jgi:nicotinamidase-related amidase
MNQTEKSPQLSFLQRVVAPQSCAVLTMEMQNGIIAGDALFPDLVARVEDAGIVDTTRRLCAGARRAGARVVHCTKVTRPDGAGQAVNCKVFALGEKLRIANGRDSVEIGSKGADLVDGLRDPSDFEVSRLHGMTPFTASALDQILRNLGISTVVLTGVSLNLGIFGMALSALDLGYQVVIAEDAVTGVPEEYCRQVLDHSLSLIATIVGADEILAAWTKAD